MVERTHITCPNVKNSSNYHLNSLTCLLKAHWPWYFRSWCLSLFFSWCLSNPFPSRTELSKCVNHIMHSTGMISLEEKWAKQCKPSRHTTFTNFRQVLRTWAVPSWVCPETCLHRELPRLRMRNTRIYHLRCWVKDHLKISDFWVRGQSSSPNALVDRSKLRLEGEKKKTKTLSKYLLKTGEMSPNIQSSETHYFQTVNFLISRLPWDLLS